MPLPINYALESPGVWRPSWTHATANADRVSALYDFLPAYFESIGSTIVLWKSKLLLLFTFFFAFPSTNRSSNGSTYLLGVGIGDVTGPIVETNS